MNISSSRVCPAVAPQIEGLESRIFLAATPMPGSIDLTFGDHGKITFSQLRPIDVQTIASAALSNGKTLLLGSANATGTSYASFELAMLNADGSLDASFGVNGVRVVPNSLNMRQATPDGLYEFVIPQSLAVDRRGRIYVGGFNNIARLKPDGSPDRGFGSFGTLTTPVSVNALTLATDGDIIVGGNEIPGGALYSKHYFGIARIHDNGTLDKSFGDHGVAVVTFRGRLHLRNSTVYALAQDAQGRILAAGGDDGAFDLARLEPNGSLDKTFGTAGKFALAADVPTPQTSSAPDSVSPCFAALAVRTGDGEIFAAGGAPRSTSQTRAGGPLVIAALTSGGQLDRRFAHRGLIQTGYGVDPADNSPRQLQINDIALLPSGKLVVAGTFASGKFNSSNQGLLLARFNANGSADPSFAQTLPVAAGTDPALAIRFLSTGGGENLSIDSFAAPLCAGLIAAPNGTLILVLSGYAGTSYNRLTCLRLHSDGSLDRSFGRRGSFFAPFLVPAQSDPTRITPPASADGDAYINITHDRDSALERITAGGAVNSSFHVTSQRRSAGHRRGATVVAVQPDRKVLLDEFHPGASVALARRNPDGSLDGSFGINGIVAFGDGRFIAYVRKAFVRPDGCILIDLLGNVTTGFGGTMDTLCLLSPTGKQLASRSVPEVTSDGTQSLYSDVAVAPDGKVVLTLHNQLAWGPLLGLDVLRLRADDLTLDSTFGVGGTVSRILEFGSESSGDPDIPSGDAVLVLPDGHILVAGTRRPFPTESIPAIALLDAAGNLDPNFADHGILTLPSAPNDIAPGDLLLQHDGKFLVAVRGSRRIWIHRFNSDGSPDLIFGSAGVTRLPRGASRFCITPTPTGEKILVALSLQPRHYSDFDDRRTQSATQLVRLNL